MTTFQESQPQSRREARQSERAESVDPAEFTEQQPDAPQTYSPEGSEDAWNASRAAAEQSAPQVPKGRRAAAQAGPPSAVTGQLEALAAQKSSIPSYGGPSFTNRVQSSDQSTESEQSATVTDDAELPATQIIQQVDRPAYRVRDFSPEARRSSPPPSSWAMPTVDDAPTVSSVSPGAPDATPDASRRPQFYVPESALQDTIVPATPPAARPVEDVTPGSPAFEHTMTRREMRALEAQRAAESSVAPLLPEFAPDGSLTGAAAAVFVETDFDDDDDAAVIADDVVVDDAHDDDDVVVDAVEPATVLLETPPTALAEPSVSDGSIEEEAADDAAAVDEVPFVAPVLSPFDALFRVPPAEPTVAPAELTQSADVVPPWEIQADPTPPADPVLSSTAPAVDESPALSDALAEFDSLTKDAADTDLEPADTDAEPAEPAEPEAESATATESAWKPPMGHWSAQGEVDEDTPGEGFISRTVGSGISTTNALVLPSIPDGADIGGPLTSGGEIMITGSIDLPRTLSATGQSDRFDGNNMDALFDLSDGEVTSTDSSPVRAIRAVSTHNSGHGVTHTQKPKGNKALTGLLIAASSLAVVVAGLLVAAFAFNVF